MILRIMSDIFSSSLFFDCKKSDFSRRYAAAHLLPGEKANHRKASICSRNVFSKKFWRKSFPVLCIDIGICTNQVNVAKYRNTVYA